MSQLALLWKDDQFGNKQHSQFDRMGHLQLSDHLVRNRQTGEQMRHWDMLNTERQISMSQCVIYSPLWRFVPHDCSAAIGPLTCSICGLADAIGKHPKIDTIVTFIEGLL